MIKIELKEQLNMIQKTYVRYAALYSTNKDVNILFINKNRFENNPKLYKLINSFDFDYKIYMKNDEILFATDPTGKTVVGITEDTFTNFDIIKDFFKKTTNL